MADTATEPRTDNDDQHRALARGAVADARRALRAEYASDMLSSDVTEEASLAWLAGPWPRSPLSHADTLEICRAIIGRVATVLVMVGWQPPKHLLEEESG